MNQGIRGVGKAPLPNLATGTSADEVNAPTQKSLGVNSSYLTSSSALESKLDSIRMKRSPDDEMLLDEINEQQELNMSQKDSDEADEREIPLPLKQPEYRVIDD